VARAGRASSDISVRSASGVLKAGSSPRCVRCLQQVLRPGLLRMDRHALGHWTMTALSLGRGPAVSWNVPESSAADRASPMASAIRSC